MSEPTRFMGMAKAAGEAWLDVAEGGGPVAIEAAVRLSTEAVTFYMLLPVCSKCGRRGGLYLGDSPVCASCDVGDPATLDP